MSTKKIQEAVEKAVDTLETKLTNKIKYQIKEICREFIYTLFVDEADEKEIYIGHNYYHKLRTLGGEIKDRVTKTALEKFNEQYKTKVEEFVAGEKFIDQIIERVNKKQLR